MSNCCYLCNIHLYNNQNIYKAFDKNFCSNKCRDFCINNYIYTENYKLEKNCESKIKKPVKRISSLPILKYNNTKKPVLYHNKIYNVPIDRTHENNQMQNQQTPALYKLICVNNISSIFNKCYSYVKIINHYSFNYNL